MNDHNEQTVNLGLTADDAPRATGRRWRLLGVGVLLVTLYLVARATGLTEWVTAERLRGAILGAGPWGVLVFLVAFALGTLVQVPGVLFIAVSVAVYGQLLGGTIGLAGALIAVSTTFCTVRAVGGRPTGAAAKGVVGKLLGGLQRYPKRTVIGLRLVTFLSPPVTYALALSPIRYRDYMIGSAVGLVPPLMTLVALSKCLLA